jgi:uncharacterized protein (DUF58 family)
MLAVGIFLIIAVAIGIISVRAAMPRVAVSRSIAPAQVHDGDRAVVLVDLVSSRTIHSATVIDKVHGLGTARFRANRLEANEPVEARYEVLCHPRGVYRIGPATVILEDPFGLAQSVGGTKSVDRLVVFPAVEDFVGLPSGRGVDPTADTTRASFAQAGGEDFFTIREYRVGDDLRRVHWPTSAKRDELMIRQLEAHWQSRALVLLDPRSSSYADDAAFEHAVSGLASAIRHLYRTGYRPTVWTGGSSYIQVDSAEGYQRAMEELAVVKARGPTDLVRVFSRQRSNDGTGGVLLMMTGDPDDAAMAAYRSLDRDFDHKLLMSVAPEASTTFAGFSRSGVRAIVARPGQHWAGAWREGMERSWSTATAG